MSIPFSDQLLLTHPEGLGVTQWNWVCREIPHSPVTMPYAAETWSLQQEVDSRTCEVWGVLSTWCFCPLQVTCIHNCGSSLVSWLVGQLCPGTSCRCTQGGLPTLKAWTPSTPFLLQQPGDEASFPLIDCTAHCPTSHTPSPFGGILNHVYDIILFLLFLLLSDVCTKDSIEHYSYK